MRGIPVLAALVTASVSGQVVQDSFTNGTPSPTWVRVDASGDALSVNEVHGRLEFAFTAGPATECFAGYRSNGWALATSADVRVRISFRYHAPSPTYEMGGIGLSLFRIDAAQQAGGVREGILVWLGAQDLGAPYRAISGSTVNADGSVTPFASFWGYLGDTTLYYSGTAQPAFELGDTGTLYVNYDAGTDLLRMSFVSYWDPMAWICANATHGLHRPVQIGLGGRVKGSVAQSGADAWIDDLQVDAGQLLWSDAPALLWRTPSSGQCSLALVGSNAALSWLPPFAAIPPSSGWKPCGIGDFNADGNTDIFWRNSLTGTNYIWFLAGANLLGGAVAPGVGPSSGWEPRAVGDLNGDSYADVVWKQVSSGSYLLWLMQGATIIGGGSLGVPGATWSLAACGDINKDGRDDLLWRSSAGATTVWYMDGTALLGTASLPSLNPALGWTLQGATDLNRDGEDDLVFRHQTTGTTVVWVMDGVSISTMAQLAFVAPSATIAGSQ